MSTFTKELDPIDVRVLADGRQCIVKGQLIQCGGIGLYLRDTLQATNDRLIRVFVDGIERSEERGQLIRDAIRVAGYTKIITVGFITEPDRSDG